MNTTPLVGGDDRTITLADNIPSGGSKEDSSDQLIQGAEGSATIGSTESGQLPSLKIVKI